MPETGDSLSSTESKVAGLEKRQILWVSNTSHAVNHSPNGIVSTMYVDTMKKLVLATSN